MPKLPSIAPRGITVVGGTASASPPLREHRRDRTGPASQLPNRVSDTLVVSRIELKLRHLSALYRIVDLRQEVCDASRPKNPPDASQNIELPPQPAETEELSR